MTPFSINGKVIYINNIFKIFEMSDAEFAEEYKDLVASDLAEDLEDPFGKLPSEAEPEEDERSFDDFKEFEDLIRQKME